MKQPQLENQLKGLSLQQKQELLETLQKKKLLQKEAVLDTFKPHAGQELFLKSPAKIRAMFSGNGFGKTTALAIDLIYTHLRRHPYRDTSKVMHSWFLIPGLDKAEDYWTELKKYCPPSQLPKPNKLGTSNIKRFEWPNGSITTMYSHDQDSSKLEGSNIDALYCDEPPPRSLWIAAFRGLRNNPEYFIVLAGTPVSEPWLYQEVYQKGIGGKDPGICIVQGSTYDNPHLSREFIKDFESRLTEEEKKVRLYGEFAHLQGRVFKEFTRKSHVFTYQAWPADWPVYCAIDPHPRKPHTVLYLGVTSDDVMVVIDELSIEGDVRELARAMKAKEKAGHYQIISRRIDNSGSGTDWNRDSFIDQLAKEGIRTNPMRKKEKDVASSIQKIKLLLKNNQLRFLENCQGMISDMELYAWQDHRHPEQAGVKEQPRKIHDDFIDPLRYIIISNPLHSPTMKFLSTTGDKTPYSKSTTRTRKTEPRGLA